VFSVQQVTSFVGAGIGIGLGGLVGGAFGWQWAFAVVGAPGSLLAFAMFRMREPKRGEAEGLDLPDPEPLPVRELARSAWSGLREDMKMIFGIRTMRFVLVGVSAMLFTVSGVGYWLAVYHERYSGFTEEQAAGVAGALLGVAGIIGTIWGGRTADKVYGAGPAGRITQVSNGILICLVLFVGSLAVPLIPLRLAMQFFGVLSAASAIPGLRASMMDVTPVHARGVSVSAFALVSTVFGTALAPIVVGAISDVTGSLVTAFCVVTPPVIVGTLILRRAKHTIVEDAAAILTTMAERAAANPDGEAADSPEVVL
jgi:MFS family permease